MVLNTHGKLNLTLSMLNQNNYGKSESKIFDWCFYLKPVPGETHHLHFLKIFTIEFLSTTLIDQY